MEAKRWRVYHVPDSLDEVHALLAEQMANARLIAGGTDLLLEIERKVRTPSTVIDISRIAGLDTISEDADGTIHLGPLVTHNQVVASSRLVAQAFPLARACSEVGSPQIRNRGTIAGNLVTASPANDTITPLMAMDASVKLSSRRGERTLPLHDLFLGVRKTALADDEILAEIFFPALPPNERGTFVKLGLRQAQAIAVVNVAVVVRFEDASPGSRVEAVRIALGAVAPTIIRCPEAEGVLVGEALGKIVVAHAAELAAAAARPIDDVRGSSAYRREMIRVLTSRALHAVHEGREREGWPARPVLLWGLNGRETHRSGSASHIPPAAGPQSSITFRADQDGQPIVTRINGRLHTIRGAAGKTLLGMLRDHAGLTGTKEGCAEGECGACTVILDGSAVMSCLVPAPRAHMAEIVTVEGLAQEGQLHPVQNAFLDAGAVQCGYCTPGFLMSGASLLDEIPSPSRDEIRQAITGNLCRCTGYYKILEALERAADGGKKS